MILLKSILAGVAALFTAALATYGVSVVAPHILELVPSREGRIDAFFFHCGSLWLWRFSSFLEVSTGVSAAPWAIARRFRKGQSSVHTLPYACEVRA